MKCQFTEEQIALYAGGDLDVRGAAAVEQHLPGCAGCRELLAGYRRDTEWLRTPTEISSETRASVRAAVVAAVSQPRRGTWRYPAVAAALAAAVGLASLTGWLRHVPPSVPAPRTAALAPLPATHSPGKAVSAPPVRRIRHRRPTPRPARPIHGKEPVLQNELEALLQADQPKPLRPPPSVVAMKLATGDPNIVIIWLQESKGDGMNE